MGKWFQRARQLQRRIALINHSRTGEVIMSTIKYGKEIEVTGIKPVVDGVVYHTRYQAHNLVTDEVKEHADLAVLVEATLSWADEPSNAIVWYEVVYQGNKIHFTPDDKVYSALLEDAMRRMVYTLRDTLRFNQSLLAGEVLDLEEPEPVSTLVTMVVQFEYPDDISGTIDEYDHRMLLEDAVEGKYHIHDITVDSAHVKEVF